MSTKKAKSRPRQSRPQDARTDALPEAPTASHADAPTATHTQVLMISDAAPWPLDQGRRIRGHHMLAALDRLGVRVRFASVEPAPADLPEHVRRLMIPWPRPNADHRAALAQAWLGGRGKLRRRLADYAGADMHQLAGVIALVEQLRPRTIIALGQNGPLMLHAARFADTPTTPPARIWYGADELVNFHLSCLRREPLRAWPTRLRRTFDHALWEQLFVRGLDGAIGVSPRDAILMKYLAGARRGICIRNGVDLDFFSPAPTPTLTPTSTLTSTLTSTRRLQPRPRSLAFWGRMDFEPNVDAMTWFVRTVWPTLRLRWPDATITIAGKHPTPAVRALADEPGVTVTGPVDDIRDVAWAAEVAILPMRCGGGIKNKLLEAAAMGKPIVATHHAVQGLELPPQETLALCDSPRQWVDTLRRLWSDSPYRKRLGDNARQWVQTSHAWDTAGRQLLDWLSTFAMTTTETIRDRDTNTDTNTDTDTNTTTPSRKAA